MVRQREKVAGMQRMLRNLAGEEGSEDDPILKRLRERRDKFRHARHRLLEDAAFYLVLMPERLPIEETARTLHTLTENGIVVGVILSPKLTLPVNGARTGGFALERWRSFWARLFRASRGSVRQRKVLDYIVHRIDEGAHSEEVVREEYVRRQATPIEVERILNRPELVEAAREGMRKELGAEGATPEGRRR